MLVQKYKSSVHTEVLTEANCQLGRSVQGQNCSYVVISDLGETYWQVCHKLFRGILPLVTLYTGVALWKAAVSCLQWAARIPELAEHMKIPPLKCLTPSPCAQSEYELSETCRACHSHSGLIGKIFCHPINSITQAHHKFISAVFGQTDVTQLVLDSPLDHALNYLNSLVDYHILK